jgi:hypothetical protein
LLLCTNKLLNPNFIKQKYESRATASTTIKANNLKKILTLNFLRIMALLVWAVGAGASVVLTLDAGHSNKSTLLVTLFVTWVLSPFVAILAAYAFFRHRSPAIRIPLYCLLLVITLVSLLGYSGVLSPAGAKPAGVFLVVPLLLWIVILIVIPVALSRSRRNSDA